MDWATIVTVMVLLGPGGFHIGGENLRSFDPPPEYRQLYEETEACVRWEGDFDEVRWMAMDHLTVFGEPAVGAWLPRGIIILRTIDYDRNGTVRHEALHDIIGGGGHPDVLFDACAPDIV